MLHTLLSGLSYAGQNLISKEYGRRSPAGLPGLAGMCFFSQVIAALAMLLTGAVTPLPPGAVWICALFGLLFTATYLCMISAMAAGPLGLTVLIVNASMAIVVVFSLAVWHEPLTPLSAAGIALIMLLLALSSNMTRTDKALSKRWFLLAALAFLGNGFLQVVQQAMTLEFPDVSAPAFTFWANVFGAGFVLPLLLILRARQNSFAPWLRQKGRFLLFAAGIGIGSALGNLFAFYALGTLPSMVVFPVRQGVVVLITWLAGILLYGDKPTARGVCMLAIGLAGIVLLNL